MGHTPGKLRFVETTLDDEDVALLRSVGKTPPQFLTNDGERFVSADETPVARVQPVAPRTRSTPYDAPDAERDANARRIVAAWNHTRNIPNEALEAVRLEEVVGVGQAVLEALDGRVHSMPAISALAKLEDVLSHFTPARSSTVEPDAHNVSDAGSTPAAPSKPRGEK